MSQRWVLRVGWTNRTTPKYTNQLSALPKHPNFQLCCYIFKPKCINSKSGGKSKRNFAYFDRLLNLESGVGEYVRVNVMSSAYDETSDILSTDIWQIRVWLSKKEKRTTVKNKGCRHMSCGFKQKARVIPHPDDDGRRRGCKELFVR